MAISTFDGMFNKSDSKLHHSREVNVKSEVDPESASDEVKLLIGSATHLTYYDARGGLDDQ